MSESEHPEPTEEPEKCRPRLEKPNRDSEKALGLEVAKLFGIPPRLLVTRPSPAASPSTSNDEQATDGSAEKPEPEQGGG